MQSTLFRVVTGLIILVLLAALAAAVIWTAQSTPSVVALPTPVPSPSPSPTPTVTPTLLAAPASEVQIDSGGFAFQPPAGYTVSLNGANVVLTSRDPQLTGAISITLRSGAPALFGFAARNLEDASDALVAKIEKETGLQAQGEATKLELSGANAISTTLAGKDGGQGGLLVVAAPAADRLFVLDGRGVLTPRTLADIDELIAGVRFFAPSVAAATVIAATPAPTSTVRAVQTPIVTATQRPAVAGAIVITDAAGTAPSSALTATRPVSTTSPVTASAPSLGKITPWTDASMINDLVVVSNTVWAATGGGALAQTRGSALPVKFTTLNGLGANALTAVVNCPLPDLGIVFGSGAGLQIADPRTGRWQSWTPANSGMKAEDVSALYCDAENQFLVIGYAEHGIDIYDAAADKWRHMDRSSGLAANDVKRLAVAGDRDAIWVVSKDGVTLAAGPDSNFYTPDNSPMSSARIGAIAVDEAGNAWLGGEGALYRVGGETWDVFDVQAVSGDFPTRLITGIGVNGDGTLWLGSVDAEICHFDPAQKRCVDFFQKAPGMVEGPVTNLVLAAPDRPYYTTDGNGYSAFDGSQWRAFSVPGQEISGNRIKALALDEDKSLWVATDAGVQRLTGGKTTVFDAENSGITPFAVRTLQAGAGGGMWVGGSQGAGFFDGKEWANFTGADGLAGDTVQAIANDDQNRTWFGTNQGISVWNGDLFFNITSDLGLPSGDIRALAAAGPVVWIGSQGGGLYKVESGQLQVFNKRNVGLPSDNVTALAVDEQGELWIGTDRGVASFDGAAVSPVTAISPTLISSLVAGAGRIWVGTADQGLYVYDGKRWNQYETTDGLPSNGVTAIAALENTAWIGGQEGGMIRVEQ